MTIAEPDTSADDDTGAPVGVRVGDAADDPVTGPMPAVELHGGRVRLHVHRDVTIVTLDGGLDSELARKASTTLAAALRAAHAVVLDLDQVALLDQAALDRLLDGFAAATEGLERCIVASRLSGRMVLERWGITSRYGVFTSVADALQARAFEANGYGAGWQPTD